MTKESEQTRSLSVDDGDFGHRDDRGQWVPFALRQYPPVFVWPPQPIRLGRWFVRSYVLSWHLFYALIAIAFWRYLSPSANTASSFGVTWIAWLLIRNIGIVVLFYGVWHLRLFIRRTQGVSFKFNNRWPKTESSVFKFGNQTRDNMFWTLASGVPIWTAFECLMLWAHANGMVTPLTFGERPVLFVLLLLAVPAFRDLHFYAVHRLLHIPVLYGPFHRLHHNNTNPGPWSGLAMHPVEHLLYFTGVLIHFIIAAHPVHIIYQLVHAGLSPAPGHTGFSEVVISDRGKPITINTYGFNHYLHHKYFECNYADGPFPFDKWFGTYHDGTPESYKAMRARLKAR